MTSTQRPLLPQPAVKRSDSLEWLVSTDHKRIGLLILGTIAVSEPEVVKAAAKEWPEQIAVSVDVRGGKVAVQGWTEDSDLDAVTVAKRYEDVGVGALIVTDIEHDPLWEAYRADALAHGLRACWSVPMIDAHGAVLGTVALYYREPRAPTGVELAVIDGTARVARIAIERHLLEAARARAEAEREQVLAELRQTLHHNELLVGKEVAEAQKVQETFLELMQSRGQIEPDEAMEEVLEDAVAFAGVSKYPARVKCALLSWMAWKDATAKALAGTTPEETPHD